MSIYKRKGSPWWWYSFTVGGVRFRASTQTDNRSEALAIEARKRSEAVGIIHIGRKGRITLNEALGRYWEERGQYCASAWSAIDLHSRHLLSHFGKSIMLDQIDDAEISRYKASMKAKPATVNRRLQFLRTVKTRAEKQWGLDAGKVDISHHFMKEPSVRVRWITPEEAERLIECAASHLKPIIRFALLTGARKANILNLKWQDVDFKRGIIRLRGVKSHNPGERIQEMPLSAALIAILSSIGPKKAGNVFLRSFTGRGGKGSKKAPVSLASVSRAWEGATERAGLEDFRFHDLRHTAATYMRMNGVPLEVVKEILGHSNISLTMRYAHVGKEEHKQAMDALSQIWHKTTKPKLVKKARH